MNAPINNKPARNWREVLFEVIFEADTPAGKWFDIVLILCIALSVIAVMLDSVGSVRAKYAGLLLTVEWFFTILFTVEYIFRLLCVRAPIRYAVSFFGIVDLLAILPTYMSLLIFSSRYLAVVRVLRVLRIFRVLKLGHHTKEATLLKKALLASRRKIIVFLFVVLTLVVIIGSLIYMIEGEENGFTSIPRSVYWAHLAEYQRGAIPGCDSDDLGILDNSRSHRDCDRANIAGIQREAHFTSLSEMLRRGSRRGC
jgi:voltage-gated potassium channel